VLFPNSFQRENLIRAGVPIRFPGDGAPFQFRMKDKGIETVTAVCAAQAGGGDRIQHDFQKNQFTPVPNYTTTLARSPARLRWRLSSRARRRWRERPIPVRQRSPAANRRRQDRGVRSAPRSGFRCASSKVHIWR
jgi:hypothetical protein